MRPNYPPPQADRRPPSNIAPTDLTLHQTTARAMSDRTAVRWAMLRRHLGAGNSAFGRGQLGIWARATRPYNYNYT